LARVDLCLGEPDRALARLERAAEERDPFMVWVPPALDQLHGDDRFARILARLGLPAIGTSEPSD
jgi:hypothetical protein